MTHPVHIFELSSTIPADGYIGALYALDTLVANKFKCDDFVI